MAKMFVKPLWLVPHHGEPVRTTLKEEKSQRQYAGGRPGLCVTADTPKEARFIAFQWNVNRENTQLDIHPDTKVPVISAKPRW